MNHKDLGALNITEPSMPLVCDLGRGTPSGLPTTQSHTWLGTPNIDDINTEVSMGK